jgi:hypothetical protein
MRECAVHGVPDLTSIACDWATVDVFSESSTKMCPAEEEWIRSKPGEKS